MTVKEFVYDYYFKPPTDPKKYDNTAFRLVKRGDDLKNCRILYRDVVVQPTDLYEKMVFKFWVQVRARTSYFEFVVLYED